MSRNLLSQVKVGNVRKVTDFTTAELAARIVKFASYGAPAWILDMGGCLDNVIPADISVSDALCELNVRKKSRSQKQLVKSFIEDAVNTRKLTISAQGYQVTGPQGKEDLTVMGGYIVPIDRVKDDELRRQVVVENVIALVTFPITKDPSKFDESSETYRIGTTVIESKKAADILMPLYPVISTFGDNKRADIDYTIRTNSFNTSTNKTDTAFAMKLLENMNCNIPGGDFVMRWRGMQYDCPLPLKSSEKDIVNWKSFYEILKDHRDYRGVDTGLRAFESIGYYYGYMPPSIYKAAYVVSDMMRLSKIMGNMMMNLEVNQVDGTFSLPVLISLVANGWCVRVINGHEFPILQGERKPGIFRKAETKSPFFVYSPFNEQAPHMEAKVLKCSDILPLMSDHIIQAENSTRVRFGYVYMRDEFDTMLDYLVPSTHAHNGHAIFTTIKHDKPLNMYDYLVRSYLANAYKTSHPFNRMTFFKKDVFAYKDEFILYFKEQVIAEGKKPSYTVRSEIITVPDEAIMLIAPGQFVSDVLGVQKGKIKDPEIVRKVNQNIGIENNIQESKFGVIRQPSSDDDNDNTVEPDRDVFKGVGSWNEEDFDVS